MRVNTRPNGKIPDLGIKLKVDGLCCMGTVHRVEETSNLHGNEQSVCIIYIKAPNQCMQSILPSTWTWSVARFNTESRN